MRVDINGNPVEPRRHDPPSQRNGAAVEHGAQDAAPDLAREPPARFEPFPVDVLPGPARALVIEGAKAQQSDPATLAPLVLGVMASAIGNSRVVELSSSWRAPAVLWSVVVAGSGMVKSPALELALRPAEIRDAEAFREWQQSKADADAAQKSYERELRQWNQSGEGDAPIAPEVASCERFVLNDATIEAVAAALQDNPRGVLLASDELAAWFGSFTRYGNSTRAGGEEARWLPLYDARTLRVDRRSKGPVRVPRAALSVVGIIQPGTLRRALSGADFDSGLVGRLLFAMPPMPRRTWRGMGGGLDADTERRYRMMVEGLYALELEHDEHGAPEPVALTLDPEAEAEFGAYFDDLNREREGCRERDGAMLAKLEGGAARLALVVHLARCACGEARDFDIIDADSMRAGITLARWFAREARRVYAMLDETSGETEHRELVEWIAARGGSVSVRELMHGRRSAYPMAEDARAALDALVQAGVGNWMHVVPDGGGRPSERFVLNDTQSRITKPPLAGRDGGFCVV